NWDVNLDDTIVAIATPPGRGGIGVVRLSGPRGLEIARLMLRLRHELEAGRAVLGEFVEPSWSVTGAQEVKSPTLPRKTAGRVGHTPDPGTRSEEHTSE